MEDRGGAVFLHFYYRTNSKPEPNHTGMIQSIQHTDGKNLQLLWFDKKVKQTEELVLILPDTGGKEQIIANIKATNTISPCTISCRSSSSSCSRSLFNWLYAAQFLMNGPNIKSHSVWLSNPHDAEHALADAFSNRLYIDNWTGLDSVNKWDRYLQSIPGRE